MAARIYAEQFSGRRFEVSTMPTNSPGVMRMTIRPPRGETLVTANVEAQSLRQIRWTGQPLTLTDRLQVQYTLVSDERDTRMGYLFEFEEGTDARAIMVPAQDIGWMMTDPDVQEALLRR